MKIGILSSIGGTIDAFFPPLIDRWHEQGHLVVTAASTSASTAPHTLIESISRKPGISNLQAPKAIESWICEQEIDILITNTATASFLARVRRMPIPVIYFCHGLHWNKGSELKDRLWQTLEKFALRNTDAVVVINDDDQKWFSGKISQHNILRLPAGVGLPIEEFPRTPIPPVEHYFQMLWAGEFSDRKRPELAVEIVQALKSRSIPFHLTMCGKGAHFERIQALIDKLNLNDSISLVGRKSNISEYITQSHGLLMTSAWEGLPRIGLESLAVGRPVFAFNVKGTRSLPGVILAKEADVNDLANLIADHVRSNAKPQRFISPMELHAKHAADKISTLAQQIAGSVKKNN